MSAPRSDETGSPVSSPLDGVNTPEISPQKAGMAIAHPGRPASNRRCPMNTRDDWGSSIPAMCPHRLPATTCPVCTTARSTR